MCALVHVCEISVWKCKVWLCLCEKCERHKWHLQSDMWINWHWNTSINWEELEIYWIVSIGRIRPLVCVMTLPGGRVECMQCQGVLKGPELATLGSASNPRTQRMILLECGTCAMERWAVELGKQLEISSRRGRRSWYLWSGVWFLSSYMT